MTTKLTFRSLTARPVLLKLQRPVVARIATIPDWPLILIDLETEEGITGRTYLEPYVPKSMKYLVPALHDFAEMMKGQTIAPMELFDQARKSLHFVGYEGLAMIAASGLDMAAWDALAKAAGLPLCELLGGSVGPVKAYNSNGLWLQEPEAVAAQAVELRDEGGFLVATARHRGQIVTGSDVRGRAQMTSSLHNPTMPAYPTYLTPDLRKATQPFGFSNPAYNEDESNNPTAANPRSYNSSADAIAPPSAKNSVPPVSAEHIQFKDMSVSETYI